MEDDQSSSPLQTYDFERVILEDDKWNKIHLSVYPSNVTLYVNCRKLGHFSLMPRQMIDVTGDTWMAKYDDDFSTVPVRPSLLKWHTTMINGHSFQLDIQWMLMNCDASRPQRERCDELSVSHIRVHMYS